MGELEALARRQLTSCEGRAHDRAYAVALGGIRRAFTTFMAKDRLNSMRRSAMSRSFSWDVSAALYGALYRKALSP